MLHIDNLTKYILLNNSLRDILEANNAYDIYPCKNKSPLEAYSRYKDTIISIVMRDEEDGLTPFKNFAKEIKSEYDLKIFMTLYAIECSMSEIVSIASYTDFITRDGIVSFYDVPLNYTIKVKKCRYCGEYDFFIIRNRRIYGITTEHNEECYPDFAKYKILHQL